MDGAFVKEVRLLEPEGDEQRIGHAWDPPAIRSAWCAVFAAPAPTSS
jgi:hypothetical protein